MIRFRAFGITFSMPWLTLVMLPLFHFLGMKGSAGLMALCLCTHELGHIAAARIARVEIREIRILPFGGSARMENPYTLPASRLFAVAAAGPAANLLLMLLSAALAHWSALSPACAASIVQLSAVLMLFNLLPALPLDGGRMLYALTQRTMGRERALNAGILLGRLLAAALLGGTLLLRLHSGKWNLSFLLAALFIFCSERDERRALLRSHAQQLSEAVPENGSPLRLYCMEGQTPASEALRLLRPRESTWFVLTKKGIPQGILDGRSMVKQLGDKGDAPVSTFQLIVHLQ